MGTVLAGVPGGVSGVSPGNPPIETPCIASNQYLTNTPCGEPAGRSLNGTQVLQCSHWGAHPSLSADKARLALRGVIAARRRTFKEMKSGVVTVARLSGGREAARGAAAPRRGLVACGGGRTGLIAPVMADSASNEHRITTMAASGVVAGGLRQIWNVKRRDT